MEEIFSLRMFPEDIGFYSILIFSVFIGANKDVTGSLGKLKNANVWN